MRRIHILLLLSLILVLVACKRESGDFQLDNQALVIQSGGREYKFEPHFTILYRSSNPEIAMRPAGIDKVAYNVATWLAYEENQADLKTVDRSKSQEGDGFDTRILEGSAEKRTPNYYNSASNISAKATSTFYRNDTVFWIFDEHELFQLEATVVNDQSSFPRLVFKLLPKAEGYFSIGYSGAPSYELSDIKELWQPFIWQEKRFPDNSYVTLSYRTPLPTTFAFDGSNTIGVLAAPEEMPFDPLPLLENSRYAVMLRNKDGKAQPQLFAPVLGGIESMMKADHSFQFSCHLVVEDQPLTYTYEKLAREYYGFRDYRSNVISSLNTTMENIVKYGNSSYGLYVDSLKGYGYSTDVPGAVKNVSSLHPLELALVMDDPYLFEAKAYPMMEYMISREKFLFSLDPEQKHQHPSRNMKGPIAPVSELGALYSIFSQSNPFLLRLAREAYGQTKVRNLDVPEKGDTWINSMHMYRATGFPDYLEKARSGADEYLKQRVNQKQTGFDDPFGRGFFFWVAFTNRWIELLELYEITGEQRYLEAAREGARHYTLHTWMSPRIPDEKIIVNKDGKAPMYWYLASKGHQQMYYPEESVSAWRLSEIGLTPESSGTCTGHRGIFMANYAPWMLRIGHYTDDDFLKEVAKASIIGRYRNFPGYHINTARTTAYEKEDYPLHGHKDISVNSFHYNHILPMASMLLDYMVSDVWVRSKENISFPSEFIEGYAYLMNKFYGDKKGQFYGIDSVQLWMPSGLLDIDHVELNYIAARKDDMLLLAFTNQSDQHVTSKVIINQEMVLLNREANYRLWRENEVTVKKESFENPFEITVDPQGITCIAIEGVKQKVRIQDKLLTTVKPVINSYQELDFGNARAMVFSLGEYGKKAYVYTRDDDSVFSDVTLTYSEEGDNKVVITDSDFPFEFTVPLKGESFKFTLSGITQSKGQVKSEMIIMGNANELYP